MLRFTYPVKLTTDRKDGGYVVSCWDMPEAIPRETLPSLPLPTRKARCRPRSSAASRTAWRFRHPPRPSAASGSSPLR